MLILHIFAVNVLLLTVNLWCCNDHVIFYRGSLVPYVSSSCLILMKLKALRSPGPPGVPT